MRDHAEQEDREPQIQIKLPTPTVPVFKGEGRNAHSEYVLWKSKFDSIIDRHAKIDVNTKYAYLLGATEGPAKKCVEGFLGDDAYQKAIQALDEQYGDGDAILDNLITDLVEYKEVHSMAELRALYNFIMNAFQTLEFYAVDIDNYALVRTYVTLAIRKVPYHCRNKWFEERTKYKFKQMRLAHFMKWFDTYIKQRTIDIQILGKQSKNNTQKQSKQGQTLVASSTPESGTESVGAGQKMAAGGARPKTNKGQGGDATQGGQKSNPAITPKFCNYCGKEGHIIQNCSGLRKAPQTEIWRMLKEERKCAGCLGSGHNKYQCHSPVICLEGGCTGRHLPPLHEWFQNRNGKGYRRWRPGAKSGSGAQKGAQATPPPEKAEEQKKGSDPKN